MGFIRMDKARESAPIVLNLIKDSGWCYAWGAVSVITIIPVLTFQVYEVWKSRKEGAHKVMQNIAATVALMANGTWMVGDLYFHDGFHSYSRWLFSVGLIFVVLYGIFSFRKFKVEKVKGKRTMMISKQTRGIVFLHTRTSKQIPMMSRRVVMARHRVRP